MVNSAMILIECVNVILRLVIFFFVFVVPETMSQKCKISFARKQFLAKKETSILPPKQIDLYTGI